MGKSLSWPLPFFSKNMRCKFIGVCRLLQGATVKFKGLIRQIYKDHRWSNREIKTRVYNGHYQLYFCLSSLKIIPWSQIVIFKNNPSRGVLLCIITCNKLLKDKKTMCVCSLLSSNFPKIWRPSVKGHFKIFWHAISHPKPQKISHLLYIIQCTY